MKAHSCRWSPPFVAASRRLVLAAAVIVSVSSARSTGTAGEPDDDVGEILALHEELIELHRKHDAAGVVAAEPEGLVVVSAGEVRFPSKDDRLREFERYLKSVEYETYEDLIHPIVRVSDDGTLGWLIARVKIAGTRTDGTGLQIPFESTWAWIELYEKHDGRWMRVGEVSTVMPVNP